jgi:transketolase
MDMTAPNTAAAALKSQHAGMANALRALAMDAVENARSGHPGMPMGMADAATVLYSRHLKFDPSAPLWPDRDRFVLSAGHGSMLLYALLHLTGYERVTLDELRRFRQLGALTAGHPEYGHCPGVETTTGPLGQGIATAVGMALAERMLNARHGDDLVDHRTWVIAGDGCLMEGLSHEAIDLAGHLKLDRLTVLFDDNGISIDGETSLATSMDQLMRFAAAGWSVTTVDGHDANAVDAALAAARTSGRPSLIACRTVIGFGAPRKQGSSVCHGAPLGKDEVAAARSQLGWPHPPFILPAGIAAAWRETGKRGAAQRQAWECRLAAASPASRAAFTRDLSGAIDPETSAGLQRLRSRLAQDKLTIATRQASQLVLDEIASKQANLAGGSADLTHSNLTRTKAQNTVRAGDYSGSYIHFGVREHAMAAAMNGLAQHGGFIPYGGTFLAFADYCRPAIRLSALMRQRVIYVMTHDSIGLGEDGPTHQPVEHLASLRAMPNVLVIRPADARETAEAWECALTNRDGPTILCLSRQALPTLDGTGLPQNPVALGAYVLREPAHSRDISLFATGSEVSIASEAASLLEKCGVSAAVISMPCWELFRAQPENYRKRVLGQAPRIGIEAAVRSGWDEWIEPCGRFIGMTGFGASAPAEALYRHFGITAEAIAGQALDILKASAPNQER